MTQSFALALILFIQSKANWIQSWRWFDLNWRCRCTRLMNRDWVRTGFEWSECAECVVIVVCEAFSFSVFDLELICSPVGWRSSSWWESSESLRPEDIPPVGNAWPLIRRDKICLSHSYRDADDKMCDSFELYWEFTTLKHYGENQTWSKTATWWKEEKNVTLHQHKRVPVQNVEDFSIFYLSYINVVHL